MTRKKDRTISRARCVCVRRSKSEPLAGVKVIHPGAILVGVG